MNFHTAPGQLNPPNILRPFVGELEEVEALVAEATLRTGLDEGVTIDVVLECISECLHITIEDLESRSRVRELVDARHLAMWTISQMPNRMTYSKIGKLFGRDHATVLHAVHKVNDLVKTDKQFCKKFNIVALACKRRGLKI